MRELRIRLPVSRGALRADHLWRFADAAPGSERPWSGSLPEADRYCVFVPPERAILVELTPPPMSARKLEQAIPWLLEAQLIEPVEHYEFVRLPPATVNDGRLRLVVLEKDWLAEVRRHLATIGHGEVDWMLAGSQWRLPDATWAIRGDGERALIAASDGRVLLAVADDGVAEAMRALLAEGGERRGKRPTTIWHAGISVAAQAALAELATELELALVGVDGTELPDEFDADVESATVLLRQRRSAMGKAVSGLLRWGPWRAAAVVLALWAGLEVLAPVVRWGQLSAEASRLRDASTELFRSTAGSRAVVVDPWLQMRRLDLDRQHARGLAVADDFLPLLDAVSVLVPITAGRTSELRYSERALEMVFTGEAADSAARWGPEALAALAAKGWRAELQREGEGSTRLRVSAW